MLNYKQLIMPYLNIFNIDFNVYWREFLMLKYKCHMHIISNTHTNVNEVTSYPSAYINISYYYIK